MYVRATIAHKRASVRESFRTLRPLVAGESLALRRLKHGIAPPRSARRGRPYRGHPGGSRHGGSEGAIPSHESVRGQSLRAGLTADTEEQRRSFAKDR